MLIGLAIVIILFKGNESEKKAPAQETELEEVVKETVEGIDNDETFYAEDVETEHVGEADLPYVGNSLKTGATPYKAFYGKNYKCPYSQCSGIRVTAPHQSDIVVIIKKNNQDGKVIQHGYICASDTYQFDISDGTYQTFFYYGEGWNPNKDMGNGVKGGFVKNEVFSKDEPKEVYSGILTYVLQLQRNGNFQTRSSNKAEMF